MRRPLSDAAELEDDRPEESAREPTVTATFALPMTNASGAPDPDAGPPTRIPEATTIIRYVRKTRPPQVESSDSPEPSGQPAQPKPPVGIPETTVADTPRSKLRHEKKKR